MFYEICKILFPDVCVKCGYLGDPLCEKCFSSFKFDPHIRDIGKIKVCSAMYYTDDSILPDLIHPFKYNHQENLFRLFAPQMIRALKLLIDPSDILLVPVPLHISRERERGYNQSAVLAKWIAKEVGSKSLNALIRMRDTGSQAKVATKIDRQKNLDGAFALKTKIPQCSQIVLVDDIVTTGSTLLACADALKCSGVKSVCALTLADRPL